MSNDKSAVSSPEHPICLARYLIYSDFYSCLQIRVSYFCSSTRVVAVPDYIGYFCSVLVLFSSENCHLLI